MGEYSSSLRYERDSERDHLVGHGSQETSLPVDCARAHGSQTEQRPKHSSLPGAVRSHNGHDFSFRDAQRGFGQGRNSAVTDGNVLELKQVLRLCGCAWHAERHFIHGGCRPSEACCTIVAALADLRMSFEAHRHSALFMIERNSAFWRACFWRLVTVSCGKAGQATSHSAIASSPAQLDPRSPSAFLRRAFLEPYQRCRKGLCQ